jgi:hypothetical protein
MARWIAVALATITGAYMLADGLRCLATGSYFGPGLGPWSTIVRGVGIEPRSGGMASAFVTFGLAWLVAAVLLARSRGRLPIIVLAVATLWYAPVGTIVALVEIALIALGVSRRAKRAAR